MLGLLPSDRFKVFIESLWEPLSKLLVSSMMTGYIHTVIITLDLFCSHPSIFKVGIDRSIAVYGPSIVFGI